MDIYITFYSICKLKRNNKIINKNIIFINNGFSFGRKKQLTDLDVFIQADYTSKPIDDIQKIIKKYKPNKIWCSLTFDYEAFIINKITNNNWIIGGPLVISNKKNKKFTELFNNNPNFVYTSLEEYLDKEICSDFDPYFLNFFDEKFPHITNIYYNLSLGHLSCYWGKCTFCSDSYKNPAINYIRNNIKKIIKNSIVKENKRYIGHTCLSCIRPNILQEITENKKNSSIWLFLRPDKIALKELDKINNMNNIICTLGLESLSQNIINKLNKGLDLNTILCVIEKTLQKGAVVRLSLITNYTFITNNDINEYEENIKKFELLYKKYPQKMIFGEPFELLNYNKELAEYNNHKSIQSGWYKPETTIETMYKTIFSKNDKIKKYNDKTTEIIHNSIIPTYTFEMMQSI